MILIHSEERPIPADLFKFSPCTKEVTDSEAAVLLGSSC
jgi:hypothetical protein